MVLSPCATGLQIVILVYPDHNHLIFFRLGGYIKKCLSASKFEHKNDKLYYLCFYLHFKCSFPQVY